MAEFRMPSLGADMESGVLLEWLVHPGDVVHRGDIVAVVDTQKAAVEIECFSSGVVERLLVEPGTRVDVGAVLATIAGDGAAAPPALAPPPAVPPPAVPAAVTTTTAPQPVRSGPSPLTSPLVRQLAARRHVDLTAVRGTGAGGRITHADVERAASAPSGAAPSRAVPSGGRVKASPLARRLAEQLGVALASVRGTGPGGVIGADDVRRAAQVTPSPAPAPALAPGGAKAPVEPERAAAAAAARAGAMRATIAGLMARSKREIPHFYLADTIDLGAAMAWLHQRNRDLPVPERLVGSVLLLKAAARAATAVPEVNGFWVDNRFVPAEAVHLGVAVSLRGGGLVAPAIHHADRLALPDLMAALRDIVARTRSGRLRGSEMSDPTITVSNLGEQGVESIFGVIYPPQVALVGFGRIVERPWAVDGLIGVRPIVTASLAADHRATDGAIGARYLQEIGRLLQRPEEL